MEIERRFLIKDISNIDLKNYYHIEIIQHSLYRNKLTSIRKRKTINSNSVKYTYTIKTGKKGISINEIEEEITEEEYNSLIENPDNIKIQKTRYRIPYINNLVIELDIFHGEYDGFIFAEIEFESEEQAFSTDLPNWFGPELTGKITNGKMAFEYKKCISELTELKNK